MLRTRGDGLQVMAQILITIHDDGSLKVEGPIEDQAWCLAVLDAARDAVKGYHRPKASGLIVPEHDLSLPEKIRP